MIWISGSLAGSLSDLWGRTKDLSVGSDQDKILKLNKKFVNNLFFPAPYRAFRRKKWNCRHGKGWRSIDHFGPEKSGIEAEKHLFWEDIN